MKFKYTRYSKTVVRPIMPIYVRNGKRALEYDVLLDSGSDINVFSRDLAKPLGIDLEKGLPASIVGMTGEAQDVSVHPIELIIGDKTLVTQVAFMDGRASYGVVGQTGFFDQFVITFDRKNEEVTINTDA